MLKYQTRFYCVLVGLGGVFLGGFFEGFTDYPDTCVKLVTCRCLWFLLGTEKAKPLKETLLLYC